MAKGSQAAHPQWSEIRPHSSRRLACDLFKANWRSDAGSALPICLQCDLSVHKITWQVTPPAHLLEQHPKTTSKLQVYVGGAGIRGDERNFPTTHVTMPPTSAGSRRISASLLWTTDSQTKPVICCQALQPPRALPQQTLAGALRAK